MAKEKQKCRKDCATEAERARAAATAEYEEMKEACSTIGDATARAQCAAQAATAYEMSLKALEANLALCLRICDSQYAKTPKTPKTH